MSFVLGRRDFHMAWQSALQSCACEGTEQGSATSASQRPLACGREQGCASPCASIYTLNPQCLISPEILCAQLLFLQHRKHAGFQLLSFCPSKGASQTLAAAHQDWEMGCVLISSLTV